MAQSISSEFNGVVYPDLLMKLVEQMDIVQKGLVGQHTGFNEDLHLPVFEISGTTTGNVNDITGAYEASPTLSSSSTGTVTYTEPTKITLADRMVFVDNIIPNAWRSVWQDYAPSVQDLMVEMQVNPTIAQAVFERIVQLRSNVDAYTLWQATRPRPGRLMRLMTALSRRLRMQAREAA
jgi:hypothetical protein